MKTIDLEQLTDRLRTGFAPSPEDTGTPGLRRVVLAIGPLDVLDWLAARRASRRVYWRSRDHDVEVAAAGCAWCVDARDTTGPQEALAAARTCLEKAAPGLRVWGGLAFDPAAPVSAAWGDLGAYAFWVPRFEIRRSGATWTLAVQGTPEDLPRLLAACTEILTSPHVPAGRLAVRSLRLEPDPVTWQRTMVDVRAALGPELAKLVLAACAHLRLGDKLDPYTLFRALRDRGTGTYDFLIQSGDTAFLGRSPECLLRREDERITTEALAGTQTEGGETDLLRSAKDGAEHDFVVQDLRAALAPLCRALRIAAEPELVTWGGLHHLRTRFEATLRPGCRDAELLAALHPSAAILGYPRVAARTALRRHESLARGWYAGPVGWMRRDASEFAVAIRSALLRGSGLHVYAGAGIVGASEPTAEWREICDKMRPVLRTVGVVTEATEGRA